MKTQIKAASEKPCVFDSLLGKQYDVNFGVKSMDQFVGYTYCGANFLTGGKYPKPNVVVWSEGAIEIPYTPDGFFCSDESDVKGHLFFLYSKG